MPTLDEMTQEIARLIQGQVPDTIRAGKQLIEIIDGKKFKDRYPSANVFLDLGLGPFGIERRYAFVIVGLARAFEPEDGVGNTVEVLNLLIKLSREVFTDKKPKELMTGTHEFKDASGETHVLEFARDHSPKTLHALVGAHRTQPAAAPKPATAEDPCAVVRRALQLLDKGTTAEWEQTFAPHCAFDWLLRVSGPRMSRAWMEVVRGAYPDGHREIDAVYRDGDSVVAETRFYATNKGALRLPDFDIPPSNLPLQVFEAHVCHLTDGKIDRMRTYFDRVDLMRQLWPPANKIASSQVWNLNEPVQGT